MCRDPIIPIPSLSLQLRLQVGLPVVDACDIEAGNAVAEARHRGGSSSGQGGLEEGQACREEELGSAVGLVTEQVCKKRRKPTAHE